MVVASAGAILLLIFLLLLILFLIFIFILLFLSVFSWRSWRLGGSSSSCHLAGMDGDAGVYRPRTRRCALGDSARTGASVRPGWIAPGRMARRGSSVDRQARAASHRLSRGSAGAGFLS